MRIPNNSVRDGHMFFSQIKNNIIMYLHIYRSYWSNGRPYQNDNFRSIMSSHRFELLLKFLHISDSRWQPSRREAGYDKLYKVRPLLNILLENFQRSYTPTQNLSIDESMVGFKGRLAFLQYMGQTERSNRKGIPDDLKSTKLRKGESLFSRDDSLLFMKWKDKRDVLMLSTFHDNKKRRRTRLAADGVETIQKPTVVEQYNLHMGCVDKGEYFTWLYMYIH